MKSAGQSADPQHPQPGLKNTSPPKSTQETFLVKLRNALLSCVPATQQFKTRYEKETRKELDSQMEKFDDLDVLNTLDAETKKRLRRRFERYQTQLVAIEFMRHYVVWACYWLLFIIVSLGSLVTAPIVARQWLNVNYSILDNLLPAFLEFSLVTFIMFSPYSFVHRILGESFRLNSFLGRVVTIGWPAAVLIGCALWAYDIVLISKRIPSDPQDYTLVTVLTLAIEFWFGFFAVLLLISLIEIAILRWKRAEYPVGVLIDFLRVVLQLAQIYAELPELLGLARKQPLMSQLEEAAKCIEHYLPRQLHSNDAITDMWFRERAKQIATALRIKKRWLLTPKSDTYDNFVDSITTTFIYVLEDNWDALERVKPEELAREPSDPQFAFSLPQLWRSRVKTILKVLFIAVGSILNCVENRSLVS